jgi:cytidyltransferase-like protein
MNRTPVIALVSGSFDPITEGHAYLLREAARLADVLHVVVGVNSSKRYYFDDDERLRLTSGVVENLELNVPTHVHFSRDRFLIGSNDPLTRAITGVRFI